MGPREGAVILACLALISHLLMQHPDKITRKHLRKWIDSASHNPRRAVLDLWAMFRDSWTSIVGLFTSLYGFGWYLGGHVAAARTSLLVANAILSWALCTHPDIHGPRGRRKELGYRAAVIALIIVGVGVASCAEWWVLGFAQSSSHSAGLPPAGPPAPPTLSVGVQLSEMHAAIAEGRVIRLPNKEIPCAAGRTGYGEQGIERLMPGGPSLHRPKFLVMVNRFTIMRWSAIPSNYYEFSFQVELTNRGESSVAKDWQLCLVQGNKAVRYPAERIADDPSGWSADPNDSIADSTLRNPIEHGHVAEGLVRFRIPINAVDITNFAGSVECKDYLDHKSRFLFSTN